MYHIYDDYFTEVVIVALQGVRWPYVAPAPLTGRVIYDLTVSFN